MEEERSWIDGERDRKKGLMLKECIVGKKVGKGESVEDEGKQFVRWMESGTKVWDGLKKCGESPNN